ncbi:hypothetical protein HJ030_21115 [Vibrio parahaemolyticus]|uniref:hypothetical protein n=1 Tax=Vibrio parahaemolyticus TaxID=670 RepID=UPI001D76F458|nr:hypothetical protein [Vibrio parahaemolyticus]MBE4385637.1 hypothetical protein [Vibrio parahaemolyticus]HCE1969743.1 hypothetical protein [Vibrio parahaemolyticus]
MAKSDTDYIYDGLKVVKLHSMQIEGVKAEQVESTQLLTDSIASSEELLRSLGVDLPPKMSKPKSNDITATGNTPPYLSWEQLLLEANQAIPREVTFEDVLSEDEIKCVLAQHAKIINDFEALRSLDRFDIALSVVAGILSGIIDIFLVQVPAHKGFLGAPSSEGGWLSNKVNEWFGELLPEDTIKDLEAIYDVSFDPSTSANLGKEVAGLGPRTHRYQSLGHDPILGFIFGVKDLLCGEFTAIDKLGNVIVQSTSAPFLEGEHFIVRLLEAFKHVGGHLLSDVNTSAGLPAPLMPLLSFFQFGTIGDKGYTIAEVARQMYRSGYDFRHFIASSVPIAISEFIVRIGYIVRQVNAGFTLKDSIPVASSPKLRRQLLVCHATAGVINAGKVTITQNPLSISWPLVLVILRYSIPELTYLMYGKERQRSKIIEDTIIGGYAEILRALDEDLNNAPQITI